jgi:hypothetical protein
LVAEIFLNNEPLMFVHFSTFLYHLPKLGPVL